MARRAGVGSAAWAAWLWAAVVAAEPAAGPPPEGGPADILSGLATADHLLGDIGGLRPWLRRYGITLGLVETSELLANATGGRARGPEYDGATLLSVTLDTQPGLGWSGGTFYASALQIHGRSLTADHLRVLQTATGFEAERATRLWELWYDQKLFGDDRFDVKVGQQALDQEFAVSSNAALFLNSALGWPVLSAADLPGGGPAYPLASPGARLRAHPAPPWTFMLAVTSGSPVRHEDTDAQQDNPSGTSFPLNRGALLVGELQYAAPAPAAIAAPGAGRTLAGVYKLGFWYDSEGFADQRFDSDGRSLADPASTGDPLRHRGDYAFYAMADQTVWQDPADSHRSVSVFARAVGAPLADRNLVDFSLNAGVTLRAPFPGRDGDSLGAAVGYAHVSSRAAALDRDVQLSGAAAAPVRGGETFIELTYQLQLLPWWVVQPDFQYFFNPGGGTANPDPPPRRVADEAVFGVRTVVTF